MEKHESPLLKKSEVEKIKEQNVKSQVPQDTYELSNSGGKAIVAFESCGRFSMPEKMWFDDLTVEHISNISFAEPETLFEVIVSILDDIKNPDCEVSCSQMTIEEFMEALLSIKKSYESIWHTHKWVCDCQTEVSDDDRKLSEMVIDLSTIQFKSILECDADYRKSYKAQLESLSDDEFKEFIGKKYSQNPLADPDAWDREKEVEASSVQEPFHYIDPEGNKYTFRLMRVGDLIEAQKVMAKKYQSKIATVQKKPNPANMPLADAKAQKEEEIKKLKIEQSRESVLSAKGITLIKYNDEDLTDIHQRINLYNKLRRAYSFDIADFQKQFLEFGVHDEREMSCSMCGKTTTRWLQRIINPIELLPLDPDAKDRKRESGRVNIYFGI